jgi:hypothetical protein
MASLLAAELKPQCLAMCGVCGGRPSWTNLGDVIITSKTWRYDTGELVRRMSGAGPEINQSVTTYQLAAPWLPKAQAAAKAWSNPADGQWPLAAPWLADRPLDHELQGLWLLRELAEGRDPLLAPEREQHCPNWEAVVEQLREHRWLNDTKGRIGAGPRPPNPIQQGASVWSPRNATGLEAGGAGSGLPGPEVCPDFGRAALGSAVLLDRVTKKRFE